MDPTPALIIRNLFKSYPAPGGRRVDVLRIPAFELGAGRQVAIRGESGLGKTTLMHIIAGILEADSGFVSVGGAQVTGLSESGRDRLRAERLGYVFQTFNLLQGLTALENVMLGLAFGKGADPKAALEALDRVGLAERAHYLPRQLSTGQQQRVAVARALANRPCLILADEPTGNLDVARGRKIVQLLRDSATALDSALLVASHDPEVLGSFEQVIDLAALNQVAPHEEEA
ncbi:MAG: ABC transporter ATP-binding protein [Holophaga sp.]|nr:ABC transporter ATP-binding protein [Holophaga sp.]